MFSGSFTITNNQSSNAAVTGLLFDSTIRSFSIILTASIVITNGTNLYETFTLEGTKASTGWTVCIGSSGDITGVTLSIGTGSGGLTDGQIYYTSPNFGANFSSGTFRFSVTQIAASGDLSAVALNTAGSYAVPSLQIVGTAEAVSGGVDNGALYIAGGATIAKSLNALNLNATGAVTAASLVAGNAVVTNLTASNAVISSSTITASNMTVTGTLTGANLAMASVTAGNLQVPGTLTVTNVTVNNLVQSSGTLMATGTYHTIGSIIVSGGNVGIATTTPRVPLHVNGLISRTTPLALFPVNGVNGLTSTGTTTITWGTIAIGSLTDLQLSYSNGTFTYTGTAPALFHINFGLWLTTPSSSAATSNAEVRVYLDGGINARFFQYVGSNPTTLSGTYTFAMSANQTFSLGIQLASAFTVNLNDSGYTYSWLRIMRI
jgi:hypothetical protein